MGADAVCAEGGKTGAGATTGTAVETEAWGDNEGGGFACAACGVTLAADGGIETGGAAAVLTGGTGGAAWPLISTTTDVLLRKSLTVACASIAKETRRLPCGSAVSVKFRTRVKCASVTSRRSVRAGAVK